MKIEILSSLIRNKYLSLSSFSKENFENYFFKKIVKKQSHDSKQ